MFLATLLINVDLSLVLDFVRSTIWRISFNYRARFALTLVPIRPISGTMFLEIFHFYFVRFILREECANVDRIIFKINCLSIRFVDLFYRLYRYNENDTEARTDMRKWETSDGKWNYYKEKNNSEANDASDEYEISEIISCVTRQTWMTLVSDDELITKKGLPSNR